MENFNEMYPFSSRELMESYGLNRKGFKKIRDEFCDRFPELEEYYFGTKEVNFPKEYYYSRVCSDFLSDINKVSYNLLTDFHKAIKWTACFSFSVKANIDKSDVLAFEKFLIEDCIPKMNKEYKANNIMYSHYYDFNYDSSTLLVMVDKLDSPQGLAFAEKFKALMEKNYSGDKTVYNVFYHDVVNNIEISDLDITLTENNSTSLFNCEGRSHDEISYLAMYNIKDVDKILPIYNRRGKMCPVKMAFAGKEDFIYELIDDYFNPNFFDDVKIRVSLKLPLG